MHRLLVPFLLCAAVSAQTPSFDVVSIKPNTSGSLSMSVGGPPGRFVAVNATVLTLVQNGYSQETFHIFGVRGWMESDRYDVSATFTAPSTAEQRRAMVRKMLVDRFKFVSHFETRAMPAYVLTLTRADGTLGPRIRPWDVDCKAVWSGAMTNPPPSSVPGIPPCGGRGGAGLYAQSGVDMQGFARSLASTLGATVIDQTGLKGQWEIHLQWNAGTPRFDGAHADEFGSLFTVLPEQLGLKLDARRMPVEVLVIDSIERPSDN
jgi:uncharacterized protein (TIGR03435 family)